MATLIWLGLRAFVFSLILTPIIRDIFRVYDIVDRPDSGRKTHAYPIPRVGGIAVAVSYVLAAYFTPDVRSEASLALFIRLLPAMGVIFAIGLIDDFLGLTPWQKLGAELVAALMAYWAGARVLNLGGHATESWWSFLLTITWLLVCTNAFNLVDGLDGLAAGIGLLSTLTIFVGGLVQNNMGLCIATLPLAGCLLAFLCYNFNPATIFLGDCGSLLIGFMLGCYGVVWSQKSLTLLGMAAPLIAFSLPLLDVCLSIFRRFLRRQPIFSADRGHIHHRLIDRGLSPRRVVLIIYGICGIAAVFALVQSFTPNYYVALLLAALFLFVVRLGIRYLGYREFTLAGRFFRVRSFQQAMEAQLALEKFMIALLGAQTPRDCWEAVRQHYPKLGFAAAHLCLDGQSHGDWGPHVTGPLYWTVRVPFENGDFIEFAREFEAEDVHSVVVPLADMLHHALGKRFQAKPGEATLSAAIGS